MCMREEYVKKFYYLFWIFIVGCVAGWIIEGIFTFAKYGVLINHSALVLGPFNVAYLLNIKMIIILKFFGLVF